MDDRVNLLVKKISLENALKAKLIIGKRFNSFDSFEKFPER